MSSRLERKRNGGIFGSWFEAGQCEDSSTTLRYGRNDILGWCGRNNVHVCHPVRSVPCRIPESSHLPPMLYQLERPPTMSSRLERKRNGGIFGSWFHAGQCEDSSTSLRFGRNDNEGGECEDSSTSLRFGRNDMGGGGARNNIRGAVQVGCHRGGGGTWERGYFGGAVGDV